MPSLACRVNTNVIKTENKFMRTPSLVPEPRIILLVTKMTMIMTLLITKMTVTMTFLMTRIAMTMV